MFGYLLKGDFESFIYFLCFNDVPINSPTKIANVHPKNSADDIK